MKSHSLKIFVSYILAFIVPGSLTGFLAQEIKNRSDVPMTRPEECLAVIDGMGSSATFAELPDGGILIALGNARFSYSGDGGITWSSPVKFQDIDGHPLDGHEGSLVRMAGNAVGYAVNTWFPEKPAEPIYIRFYRSDDGGKTWQRPPRINPESRYGVVALNDTFVRTISGRIILPVYSYMDAARDLHSNRLFQETTVGHGCCFGLLRNEFVKTSAHHTDPTFAWSFAYYSDDEGRNWKTSQSGEIFIWDAETMMWSMTGEPTTVEVEPGKLLMFVRNMLGRLFKSWSFDNGQTWSAPMPTQLAASGAPAQLRKIPGTGDLLVVWTQSSEEEMRKGLTRTRLSTAVSRTHLGVLPKHRVRSGRNSCGPGPIRFVRPEGVNPRGPTEPAPVRDPKYVVDLPETYAKTSYPSVFFHKDRLLVGNTNAHYTKEGKYVMPGRIRVVPISWLYGGPQNMKPSDELKKKWPIQEP